MSAGMTVAARVPSAPPFLSPVSSFINCASLNASAPPVSEEKPMAPPEALDLQPPPELTSLVAPLKAIAPAVFVLLARLPSL